MLFKNMDRSISYIIVIFSGWTITSFLCHYFAKLFLINSSIEPKQVFGNILYLTGMQTVLILMSMYRENNSESVKAKFIIMSMHECATMATNWSIAISHAASTFAIKLMEPLTGAVAQRLILNVKISYIQCLSIPLVIIGAIMFANDSNQTFVSISEGSVLAFNSNIFLAFRNVYIKQTHLPNINIFLNYKILISDVIGITTAGILLLMVLTKHDILSRSFWYLYLQVSMSAFFHTTYTYISTVLVLKHFSVVSHAFGNIVKRLLVITLLYLVGSRSATHWNFFGIIICIVGLVLYVGSKLESAIKIDRNNKFDFRFQGMIRTKNVILLASTVLTLLLLMSPLRSYRSPFTYHLLSSEINDKVAVNSPSYSKEKLGSRYNQLSVMQTLNFSIEEFYANDLTKYPGQANKLSRILTKRADVISEAQRVHINIFSRLLKGYKYAMLFDYATSENRGDAAIGVGESILLRSFNIDVIFTCAVRRCIKRLDAAQNLSKNYTNNELVILLHGTGSIIGFPNMDKMRFEEISYFRTFNIIMFPSSILFRGDSEHIELSKKVYSSHPSLTFIWRDSVSYTLSRKLFPNVRSLLSPDIAFQIGQVKRFMVPTLDIIWLKRVDGEAPSYTAPKSAGNYSMQVSDWKEWSTPKGTSLEDSYSKTANGLLFLSRGKVLVTDRLHGFIFSILLNIPVVFIDNKQHKLSNYHKSWTFSLKNTLAANSSEDALEKAKFLLKKLDKELPKV